MANGRHDIRVAVGTPRHAKILGLIASLGKDAAFDLISLWCYTAENHPDGVLPSPEQVEVVVGWRGAPGALHAALVKLRLLEEDGVTLHDWIEEQPWVVGRSDRVKRASMAGSASVAARQRMPNGTLGPSLRVVGDDQRTTNGSPTGQPTPSPLLSSPSPSPMNIMGGGKTPPVMETVIHETAHKVASHLGESFDLCVRAVAELVSDGVSELDIRRHLAATDTDLGVWAWKRACLAQKKPGAPDDHGPRTADSQGRLLAELGRQREDSDRMEVFWTAWKSTHPLGTAIEFYEERKKSATGGGS